MNHARTCDPNTTGKSASLAIKLDLASTSSTNFSVRYNSLQNIHPMKKTALLHLLISVAGLATVLLPISVLAAPGDLYEADFSTGTIFKFTPGGVKSTFATGVGQPSALAFDASGNLFAMDNMSHTMFKFTPAGVKTTFASGLTRSFGLAFDASGNLFDADFDSNTIFIFTPAGTKTTFTT